MANEPAPRKIGAGALAAAMRQGGKEIGTALKAFPDSISVDEPGTALSPTQGEIAEANRSGSLWGRVQDARERAEATKEPPEKGLDRE
jgi:hypothetical protein